MKGINNKKSYLNRVLYSKKKPSRPVIIQNISCIYKKNVKYDKNQINLIFFCEKAVSKPVRS